MFTEQHIAQRQFEEHMRMQLTPAPGPSEWLNQGWWFPNSMKSRRPRQDFGPKQLAWLRDNLGITPLPPARVKDRQRTPELRPEEPDNQQSRATLQDPRNSARPRVDS